MSNDLKNGVSMQIYRLEAEIKSLREQLETNRKLRAELEDELSEEREYSKQKEDEVKEKEEVIRELTSSLVYIVKTLGALTLPQDEPEALAYYEALKAIEKAKSLTTKDK